MSETVTVTEMSRNFADYMNRIKYRREGFILTKGNEPFAEIKPLKRGISGARLVEILSNGPHLDPEDVENFAKDIEEGRKYLESLPVRDPWED